MSYLKKFKDYSEYEKWAYSSILEIASHLDIESLDMAPIFGTRNPEALRHEPDDFIHFNQKGSGLVAGAIYDYLKGHLSF